MIKDDIGRRVTSGILHDGEYGIEIETETKGSYKIPKFTFWNVKPDGSLRDFGQEYVLRAPLNYGKDLSDGLEEFRDKTKGIYFIPDSNSTSVHVHCNILGETWQSTGNFLTIYTLVENLLMEVAGEQRRNNLFCLPIRSVPLISKLSVDVFKNVNKKNFNFGGIMDANAVKYAALNLAAIFRFGSLEIRSFRGETDIDVIQSWIDILHRIRVFSRENVTPPEILDGFRDKGKKYLKNIFQEDWKGIQDNNEDKLIMDNLWFAGQLAYQFPVETWKKFDLQPPAPKIPDGITIIDLDHAALNMYGSVYNNLSTNDQIAIIALIELQKGKRKRKSAFANPAGEFGTTLQPSEVSWNSAWALSTGEVGNGGQT